MNISLVVVVVLSLVLLGLIVLYAVGAPWYKKVCTSGNAPDGMPCGMWKPETAAAAAAPTSGFRSGYSTRGYH